MTDYGREGRFGYFLMGEPSVLVVGAGPTGLMLAAELAQAGVSVRLGLSPGSARRSRVLSLDAVDLVARYQLSSSR